MFFISPIFNITDQFSDVGRESVIFALYCLISRHSHYREPLPSSLFFRPIIPVPPFSRSHVAFGGGYRVSFVSRVLSVISFSVSRPPSVVSTVISRPKMEGVYYYYQGSHVRSTPPVSPAILEISQAPRASTDLSFPCTPTTKINTPRTYPVLLTVRIPTPTSAKTVIRG